MICHPEKGQQGVHIASRFTCPFILTSPASVRCPPRLFPPAIFSCPCFMSLPDLLLLLLKLSCTPSLVKFVSVYGNIYNPRRNDEADLQAVRVLPNTAPCGPQYPFLTSAQADRESCAKSIATRRRQGQEVTHSMSLDILGLMTCLQGCLKKINVDVFDFSLFLTFPRAFP